MSHLQQYNARAICPYIIKWGLSKELLCAVKTKQYLLVHVNATQSKCTLV